MNRLQKIRRNEPERFTAMAARLMGRHKMYLQLCCEHQWGYARQIGNTRRYRRDCAICGAKGYATACVFPEDKEALGGE